MEQTDLLNELSEELKNFESIARYLLPQPGEVPQLDGIDIFGSTLALNGVVGGDHLIYVDFKKRFDLETKIRRADEEGRLDVVDNLRRCQQMAGIVLIDVSGHRVTDALLAAMLHQAFLLGATYELDMFGHITRRLFENLNTRFYNSSASHKFVSMIYGEISERAMFRFLSAAQPFPVVFSRVHDRFMEVGSDLRVSFPPLGVQPSLEGIERSLSQSVFGFKDRYLMNEWVLMGEGDILLVHTDGLTEHSGERGDYFPHHLEQRVRDVKDLPARGICDAIKEDLLAFAPPSDDISLVVIKRG